MHKGRDIRAYLLPSDTKLSSEFFLKSCEQIVLARLSKHQQTCNSSWDLDLGCNSEPLLAKLLQWHSWEREGMFLKLKVEATSITAFYTFLERNHLDFKRTKQKYEQEVGLKLKRGQSCVSWNGASSILGREVEHFLKTAFLALLARWFSCE